MSKFEGHTPGYEVTTDGKVFSFGHNWRGYGVRELDQHPNSHGYPSVRMTINGRRKRYLVHKLVMEAHGPQRPGDEYQIRHLDGDKKNNHISNLKWGTAQDNADDREIHGNTSRGERHSFFIKMGIEKNR